MTIVGLTTIHPNPGVKWEDVQKLIKGRVPATV
jgi:hypothetical protein